MKSLLLNDIRSLLNVGALFRSADGAGFDRVYLTGITPTPPRREISKTALGAERSVTWEYYADPLAVLRELSANGCRVVALEQDARSVDYRDLSIPPGQDVCVVVGNETGGVSAEVLALCSDVVELPMRGMKKSLNVAVSGGIILYRVAEICEPRASGVA